MNDTEKSGGWQSNGIESEATNNGYKNWNHSPNLPPTPPNEKTINLKFSQEDACCISQTPVSPNENNLIAVIGVGYVGFHLVQVFAPKFSLIAFDVSAKRLDSLQEEFARYLDIISTTDARLLRHATHFLIAVPTVVRPDRSIDLSYLKGAIKMVSDNARRGATVVIESSVAVGMTRELLSPLMRAKGIKAGMSPERVDPGRTGKTANVFILYWSKFITTSVRRIVGLLSLTISAEPPAHTIPKIISGIDDITPGSLASIHQLYSGVFQDVVQVSKPEVAEMMKLYENCQRMICIAYANEMADACISHGIDPYEVCKAAASKPFGYMPFSPGLGVGGPCIPCNP
jgi:UDP-N-acetyl-D-mannosaminuronate dehydrogenase